MAIVPVDDLWYLSRRGADGERVPSKRHGRGKRWRVRWTDPDTGKPRTQLFGRKPDAERHDATVRVDLARGQYVDPRSGQVTVAQYGEQWRAQQLHRDSTADLVARAFRLHIEPIVGDLPLGQVRAGHLRSWVKDRAEVLEPSTLRLIFGYLSSMFAAAVLDRAIGVSPCVGVRLPTVDRGERFIPSAEQVHAVAEALPARYRAVVYVAAGCGLRGGEIFGLELDDVAWLQRELDVLRQAKKMPGQPAYLGPPKTKTSRRTVELPAVTSTALAQHVERFPPVPLEIQDRTGRAVVTRSARLLFTTSTGRPMTRSNWSIVWRRAVKRAGLPAGEDFTLHTLRHYFATLLIHAGASVKTVQLALGHSSPMVTLSTYTHEWPDAIDRTRALVDAALGTGTNPVQLTLSGGG